MSVSVTSNEHLKGILRSTKVVVVDFYADWCEPCRQIAPYYEKLASSINSPNDFAFLKVDSDAHQDISKEYNVSVLPTFLLFRDGNVATKVQGANPRELKKVIESIMREMELLGAGAGSSGASGDVWNGAAIPKGYADITSEIEVKGCELLNADEDAGAVSVLFASTKPSAIEGKGSQDWVQSGADDQLLLFLPFQSSVKLHTIQLTSLPPDDDDDAPARPEVIHLYINRPRNMDFSEADDTDPTQVITLEPSDWNENGTANINLRFVKFQKTTSLIIYVQRGHGDAESVRLDRVRLIGDAGTKREMGKLVKVGDEPGE